MNKQLLFYKTKEGKTPLISWLDKLKDKVAKIQILRRLDRIKIGHYGDHKHIQSGVYELRLHQRSGYRIYYSNLNDVTVILLIAGNKSSQQSDIEKALLYWQDFQERYHE